MEATYINGFSCLIKEDKSEVIVIVNKNYPKVNDLGDIEGNECENVATLIMTTDTAIKLKNALDEIINSETIQ